MALGSNYNGPMPIRTVRPSAGLNQITKNILFQRNKLTGGSNPTFDKREIAVYS